MGEFDGIKENEEGKKKMPLGMALLFLGLLLFGVGYIYLYLPQTTGWTQKGQYEKKMQAEQALQVQKHAETEGKESAAHEQEEALERGGKIYRENCATCHGARLEGGIAPTLLGPRFVYGDSVEDHIKIISKGTPKGMPGYARQLSAEQIYNVSYYIHSMHKEK